jgi:hypothetical protein
MAFATHIAMMQTSSSCALYTPRWMRHLVLLPLGWPRPAEWFLPERSRPDPFHRLARRAPRDFAKVAGVESRDRRERTKDAASVWTAVMIMAIEKK